jgi:hypothetical protein
MALQLVQDGMVGRLVVWMLYEVTAGAATGLLCPLLAILPQAWQKALVWHMALQVKPAMLQWVCMLTFRATARARLPLAQPLVSASPHRA